jgi:hypothetical protein
VSAENELVTITEDKKPKKGKTKKEVDWPPFFKKPNKLY